MKLSLDYHDSRTDFIPFSPISKSSLRPPKADCDRRVCLDSIISYGFQGEGVIEGISRVSSGERIVKRFDRSIIPRTYTRPSLSIHVRGTLFKKKSNMLSRWNMQVNEALKIAGRVVRFGHLTGWNINAEAKQRFSGDRWWSDSQFFSLLRLFKSFKILNI